LLLWFLNILCEAKKWQSLIKPFISITIRAAFQQVFAGTTTGVGSPGRIAEMGGRMALLPKMYRTDAAIMTTIGGFIQSSIIFGVGLLALFLMPIANVFYFNTELYVGVLAGLILIILLALAAVWRYSAKARYYLRRAISVGTTAIGKAYFWTLLRYLIYNMQLLTWMHLMGVEIDNSLWLGLSCLYFFFVSIVPSHIIIDMGIRGSVALFLFLMITDNTIAVLSAIFAMWMTNVIIPTLIGSVVLIKQKPIKEALTQKET